MYLIKGEKDTYELTIGIEVHAQINSKRKLFSDSPVTPLAEPNTCVNFFDMTFPGMLPVLNFHCVEQAVKTGLAIGGEINRHSIFDRKHYFYPDLPQGYQITQFYEPIVRGGVVEIISEAGSITGEKKIIRVNRIHIEQDAGKLTHDKQKGLTYVDLNRAGVGLMEIVSEADIKSPYEACEYVKALRAILREVESSDADMERGNFRCDVNISIAPIGSQKLGTRCEVKNLNSFRFVQRSIEFEAQRQMEIIESGGSVRQETRLFDPEKNETRLLRVKEDSDDYRYFPDPDLLPVDLTEEFINTLAKTIPELPMQRAERYVRDCGIAIKESSVMAYDKDIYTFFEASLKITNEPKLLSNWILSELLGRLNKSEELISITTCKVKPKHIASLVSLIAKDVISGKIAKYILDKILETGQMPDEIIKNESLIQVSDETTVLKVIHGVIDANQDKLAEYKSGKIKLFGFFVGECMKQSGGKVNPVVLNKLLKNILE